MHPKKKTLQQTLRMLIHYKGMESGNSLLPTDATKVSCSNFMKNFALFYNWDWTSKFMISE